MSVAVELKNPPQMMLAQAAVVPDCVATAHGIWMKSVAQSVPNWVSAGVDAEITNWLPAAAPLSQTE